MVELPVIQGNYADLDNKRSTLSYELRELFSERNCERILLINPPQTTREVFDNEIAKVGNYPCYPPYNLALLSKGLEDRGYTSDILDMNYELLERAFKVKDNFAFNENWEDILKNKLDNFKPDLVGITCMYTMVYSEMKNIADFVKGYKKIPIIVGGGYPALAAEEVLRKTETIDLVSLYESDDSFPDMVDFINQKAGENKLTQLAKIVNGEYIALEDRNTPSEERIGVYPQWHGLKLDDYSRVGKIGVYARWMRGEDIRCGTILSSRGCRAHCDFCSVREFNGKGVRHRSIESVINEIETLRDNYGIRHLVWLDDDLLANGKGQEKFFGEMANRNLGITWDASNGVIAASLTDRLAQLAEESGCIGMSFGIESGDPYILKEMRKPATLQGFEKASEILQDHPNIFTKGFLILGYPSKLNGQKGESIGQIWNTIGLAKKMHLDWYSIHLALPLPQTDMAKKMEEIGQIQNDLTEESSQSKFMYGFGNIAAREYEKKRKLNPDPNFYNILLDKPMDYVPNRAELKDIWFLMDYYINYEDIPKETNLIKLGLKEKWLAEICSRRSSENPLGNLYLAVVRDKLGKVEESEENRYLAREFMKQSEFWSTRFRSLGLEELLNPNAKSLI